MYKVINLSKATWGLKLIIIKTIYLTVIEKILYASNIWFNEKEKFKVKLPQLQRTALLAITKCYRTVSTETLLCLIWMSTYLFAIKERK